MGACASIPLVLGSLSSCCAVSLASLFTSTAASMLCLPCHCASSMATRVGYALLFCVDALAAWVSLAPSFARAIESATYRYVQVRCVEQATCVGVLAVHRITLALVLFHLALALLLADVHDSRHPRATLQNGWWGFKIVAWFILVLSTFFLPSSVVVLWANYVAPVLAVSFIFLGLVLLVDFAHTWSETCLDRWERYHSDVWKYVLVGTTLGLYVVMLGVTVLLWVFFGGAGCGTNRALLGVHVVLVLVLSVLCVHPSVQEANPRSGLAQSSMVLAYMTYLLASALMNRDDKACNPIARGRGEGAHTTTAVLGVLFTFLAIAYSTTRAATHTLVLGGDRGDIALDVEPVPLSTPVSVAPAPQATLRIEAIRSAVAAGSVPQSVLDDELQAAEEPIDQTDDERGGTRYNYSIFHLIFAVAACYTAMLLTDWHAVRSVSDTVDTPTMYIGTSSESMRVRIVSSWMCAVLYGWSLLAPALCT